MATVYSSVYRWCILMATTQMFQPDMGFRGADMGLGGIYGLTHICPIEIHIFSHALADSTSKCIINTT